MDITLNNRLHMRRKRHPRHSPHGVEATVVTSDLVLQIHNPIFYSQVVDVISFVNCTTISKL